MTPPKSIMLTMTSRRKPWVPRSWSSIPSRWIRKIVHHAVVKIGSVTREWRSFTEYLLTIAAVIAPAPAIWNSHKKKMVIPWPAILVIMPPFWLKNRAMKTIDTTNSSHPTKTRYRTDPVREDLGELWSWLKCLVISEEMTAVMNEKNVNSPNMTGWLNKSRK